MVKFMLKCFIISTILLFGVLIGMQQANVGLLNMRGYEDPDLKGAFYIPNEPSGEVEATVLGEEVTSHNLEQKQEKLEKIEAFNLFSQAGKWIANGVSSLASTIASFLGELISNLLSKI
ncbi:YqxA family protein [Metabacillus arenae]|uniref:YqxA family protein n=1 Tax=Metabacillus arenae TaxID=2771434 RepID=A0A926RYS7_9BACI|nr:YqxA family protein [Metabacillus arenae]MBD1382085.1 YqxA family protein [Metabacillus arenae]